MSEHVKEQAFEPFFTTSRDKGGSGLGLYVIYTIVTQQMAGTIQILSVPNEGVHFHIECPIEASPYITTSL
jgi:signal transduction histidine kinase